MIKKINKICLIILFSMFALSFIVSFIGKDGRNNNVETNLSVQNDNTTTTDNSIDTSPTLNNAQDKKETETNNYIKPKNSLNANMYDLLKMVRLVKSDADIETIYRKESNVFRIEIVSPVLIEGFGNLPSEIDRYDLTFVYVKPYSDLSAGVASLMSAYLGGSNLEKVKGFEKVFANLQNQMAKKIKKSKETELKLTKKYNGYHFSFTFFRELGYGVVSITKDVK